jgi:hypothetical protein
MVLLQRTAMVSPMVDPTPPGSDALRRNLRKKWEERDRRRGELEAYYADLVAQTRAHHVGIVARALRAASKDTPPTYRSLAETAVDALTAEGIVFARLSDEIGDT